MSQTRIPDARLDAALRSLDAAPAVTLDDVARVRAAAALEQTLIIGRFPDERASLRRDPLVPRRRRTGMRVAMLGAAAAAVAVGIGVTQVLGGGTTAYADSWEPVPVPASAADIAAAQTACADSASHMGGIKISALLPQLAERRGDLVLLVMDDGTAEPVSLTCMVALPPGEDRAHWIAASGGGGGPRPAPGEILPGGEFEQATPGDELSVVDGDVGDGVTAVTVHTEEGLTVQATVQNGHFAAWWPGRLMRMTSEPYPSGQSGGCAGNCDGGRPVSTYTLDFTRADGTVVTGIAPNR
ncbi:hypothetical protein SAMN06264364_12721 [Quadrisphaera granulorum]|uniref:Uncharacterized protein n=1 Tax=Quadrisphaera granulorum TaxID=317664 RepID=A0A315ZVR1_9ACTN|nr:hypothetical protein [Quadrisphaera granulorum]PWJ49030.1 hypothetical protein BXY45_12721 [Quadrisphaera granulorum]SZE98240.1 hypothetical protein SAMN06264364_12721 [Quadrisphaera granulorum]